MHSFYNMAYII